MSNIITAKFKTGQTSAWADGLYQYDYGQILKFDGLKLPEGLFSVMTDFPKIFDSERYDGDIEAAMKAAKSAYFDQLSKNYGNANPARVMMTVTLETAGGVQILKECVGGFPVTDEPTEE